MRSFPQYFNQKKQSLISFCAPFYSEIIFSKGSTGKWNGMEKNKSGVDISPSDPSFDIHGGFQNKFKTCICAWVKKEVNLSTFIPLRKHYTHFLIYSTTELEDNRGKLYSNYLNNGKAKGRLHLHSFLHAFSWLAEEVWNHLKSYCHSSISNVKPDSQVLTVLLRLMNIFPCEKGKILMWNRKMKRLKSISEQKHFRVSLITSGSLEMTARPSVLNTTHPNI